MEVRFLPGASEVKQRRAPEAQLDEQSAYGTDGCGFESRRVHMSDKPTRVVNIRRGHHYDVYVGRAGRGEDGYFGNPFRIEPEQGRGATLGRFREYFEERLETDAEFALRVRELKGKDLGCFCVQRHWTPPDGGHVICHAQIIALYLEAD